tara:strand:+ start:267 stop:509 length:243 start_codon:yes stop_codon:yes gene_type:complete
MDISEHLEQFYLEFYDTCQLGANIEASILKRAHTNMLTSEEIKTLLNMGRMIHKTRQIAIHDSVWWEPITDARSNNNVSG